LKKGDIIRFDKVPYFTTRTHTSHTQHTNNKHTQHTNNKHTQHRHSNAEITPPVILDLENNIANIFRRGVVFFNFIFEYNHFKLMAKAKKIRPIYSL